MRPKFLTVEHLLLLHASMIETYGGDPGIRDKGLLESAAAQPQAMFGGEYLHPDMAEMAAAYLFHLCQNHAFVDGNKRIAAAAALMFLDVNGLSLGSSESEMEALTMAVARGERSKAEIAAELRRHMIPRA
jgi:death-on-curing protein